MQTSETTISLYENAVPDCAVEMEKIYQHLFAIADHHATYGSINDGTRTYVARENGKTTAAFLFEIKGDTLRVLNEQMRIGTEDADRFSRHIFAAFENVNVIVFHAVELQIKRLSHPSLRSPCTEDIVLVLPGSVDEYRGQLGKSTRSYISRYMNKLHREFRDVQYEFVDGAEVNEDDVLAIIAMNKARMSRKHRETYIDGDEAARIMKMVRERGMLCLLRIEGKLCAGSINLRVANNYFLKIIAHDPAYDDYRLGTLCCFHTVCKCIERGAAEYHFLWGRFDYKFRLLGKQRDLESLCIYRSRAHLLMNSRTVLKEISRGLAQQARYWIINKTKQNKRLGGAVHLGMRTAHTLLGRRNATAATALNNESVKEGGTNSV